MAVNANKITRTGFEVQYDLKLSRPLNPNLIINVGLD